MIFTDFAPNETTKDIIPSLKMLFSFSSWKTNKLENELKKEINDLFPKNNSEVRFFMSARSALYFTLQALNLPANSKVAVQGFTCEAVVLPILKLDLKPLFIDIDEKTFSMNPTELERKISKDVKVIILQHTYGIIPHRDEIISIAKGNNILVIEDLAHGFQKNSFEKDSNTIKLLSFGRSKSFSSVFGGAVLFKDDKIREKLDSITANLKFPPNIFLFKILIYKPYSILIKSTFKIKIGKILHKIGNSSGLLTPEVTEIEKSGIYDTFTDYKYPDALAKLTLIQLKRFKEVAENRKKITEYYSANLSVNNNFLKGSLIRFPILTKSRKEILKEAENQNIFLGKWYDQVIAPSDVKLDRIGYNINSCPNAEELSKQIITLPTTISIKDAKKITQMILKYEYS